MPESLPAKPKSAAALKRSSSTECLSTMLPGTSLREEYALASSLLAAACVQDPEQTPQSGRQLGYNPKMVHDCACQGRHPVAVLHCNFPKVDKGFQCWCTSSVEW